MEKPSVYTLIYWLIQDKKIEPDALFDFLEFYWPTFLERDGYVFLKEKFSEDEYAILTKQNVNVEYWMNLLTVDDFFSEIEDEEKAITLVKALVEIWQAKLNRDFPSISFTVGFLQDEEYGDYGLTFYQNSDATSLQYPRVRKSCGDIPRPSIKQNKINLSPTGPKPGKPEIRKPRSDEIPGGG